MHADVVEVASKFMRSRGMEELKGYSLRGGTRGGLIWLFRGVKSTDSAAIRCQVEVSPEGVIGVPKLLSRSEKKSLGKTSQKVLDHFLLAQEGAVRREVISPYKDSTREVEVVRVAKK